MAEPVPAEKAAPPARLYGEALEKLPLDLYIPPDALEVFLDAFQGPLDLLLYLIRKANVDILDIPMAPLTAQYLVYVEAMRSQRLELAAEYLLMAAMLLGLSAPCFALMVSQFRNIEFVAPSTHPAAHPGGHGAQSEWPRLEGHVSAYM